MNLSVKVEKHSALNRKQRKEYKDVVGSLVELTVSALGDRLKLPKKVNVVAKTSQRGESGEFGGVSDLSPSTLSIYGEEILRCVKGDMEKFKVIGVGVVSHELSHMATNYRNDHQPDIGSGDELFDAVVEEGKADAVARTVIKEQFRAKASIFARHEGYTPGDKVRTLKALTAPRHVATSRWSRITGQAFNADIEAFEQASGLGADAMYVAGGLICDRYMQITGRDPITMQSRPTGSFFFSYQELMREAGYRVRLR